MITLPRIALVVGTAAVVAACGSSADTPPPSPKVVSAPESTVAPRTAPATFDGEVGDTLALQGPGLNDIKTAVKVTLKGTKGPFKGYDLPSGRKLIGVVVRFSNEGSGLYDDPQPRGELVLAGGKKGKQTNLIQLDGSKNPCKNPSVKLKTGQSRSACLAFEVPKGARPESFEFVTDSGYGDTGRWAL
jgi:hypothetical protein